MAREVASRPAEVIILDEVSMVSGKFLDNLNTVARGIRGVNVPMGSIRLIIFRDFLQLPPVVKREEERDRVRLSIKG